jgi:hypothetical protein
MKIVFTSIFSFVSFVNILAQNVKIEIDLSAPQIKSQFQIGVTHTHGFWEYGNLTAVERARNLLINGIAFQNQHIMGWGAGNPEPQPGILNWNDLNHRVDLMQSIGTPMIITFCTAPGWMKGTTGIMSATRPYTTLFTTPSKQNGPMPRSGGLIWWSRAMAAWRWGKADVTPSSP